MANGFRAWIKKQERRNDRVGDVARDLRHDDCAKRLRNIESLIFHLEIHHNASDAAKLAMRTAYGEWLREIMAKL